MFLLEWGHLSFPSCLLAVKMCALVQRDWLLGPTVVPGARDVPYRVAAGEDHLLEAYRAGKPPRGCKICKLVHDFFNTNCEEPTFITSEGVANVEEAATPVAIFRKVLQFHTVEKRSWSLHSTADSVFPVTAMGGA